MGGSVRTFIVTAILLASATGVLAWDAERPSDYALFAERTESQFTNSEAALGIGVRVDQYFPRSIASLPDQVFFYAEVSANTRKAISYDAYTLPTVIDWKSGGTDLNLGDDQIKCVILPWSGTNNGFRFYGGGGRPLQQEIGSAEYWEVCISSNGFLTFDPGAGPSPSGASIPSTGSPNAVIAPFWTDLDASTGAVRIVSNALYFAVTWENVRDKTNNEDLTFQVLLELESRSDSSTRNRMQDKIKFLYQSVTCRSGVIIGIEDHEGLNGMPVSCPGSGSTHVLQWFTLSPEIRDITVEVEESDPDGRLLWERDYQYTMGENVETSLTEPPASVDEFQQAMKGAAGILQSTGTAVANRYGGKLIRKAVSLTGIGTIIMSAVMTLEDTQAYVESLHRVDGMQLTDSDYNENLATARVSAIHGGRGCSFAAGCWDWPVDTTFGVTGRWQMRGDIGDGRSITIRAKMTYNTGIAGPDLHTIETPVTLTLAPEVGDSLGAAKTVTLPFDWLAFVSATNDPDDFYKFYVACGKRIHAEITPRESENFQLHLYSPAWTLVASSAGNAGHEELTYDVDASSEAGNYYLDVHANFGDALYDISISLIPISCGGGGGGGSPFVAPWNGSGFEVDNNILPLSEVFDREETDTEDHYRLHIPLVEKDGLYSLQLTEFEEEHSFIDAVDLWVVDHDEDARIGVHHQTGQILTFAAPEAPEAAADNYGRDVLHDLTDWDGTYFEGWRGDWVELDFGGVTRSEARLVIVADPPAMEKTRILVEFWNGTGWQWIDSLHHRMNFSYDIVDLSAIVPAVDLKIRLVGVSRFALEQVGLDTSPTKPFTVTEPSLQRAVHSSGADVTGLLAAREGSHAEMVPGEAILVDFSVPVIVDPDLERSFILVSYGHYTHQYQPLQGTDVIINQLNVDFQAIVPEAPPGLYWDVELSGLEWFLGDGATATGFGVIHTYAEAGEYLVTIVITYEDGAVKSYERRILVS